MRLWKRLYWLQGGSLKYFGWDLGDPRYFGGVGGAPRGSTLPQWGAFCPSGSLVQHQNWFQIPHYGSTGQASLGTHHWPNALQCWISGTLLRTPKRPLYEQMNPFRNPRKSQNSIQRVQNAFYLWRPYILSIIWHLGPNLVTLGHLNLISHDLFSGRKARFWTICVSKGLDLLKKWPFEGP